MPDSWKNHQPSRHAALHSSRVRASMPLAAAKTGITQQLSAAVQWPSISNWCGLNCDL